MDNKQKMSISEVKEKINSLVNTHSVIEVTKYGKSTLALLPWELFECIMETVDILSDDQLMDAVRESEKDLKRGRTVSHDKIKRRFG